MYVCAYRRCSDGHLQVHMYNCDVCALRCGVCRVSLSQSCTCLSVCPQAVFVGYQLLRAMSELRRRGVAAGDIRLSDVWVDSTLWLRLRPRLPGSLCRAALPAERVGRAAEELNRVAEAGRGSETRRRKIEGRSGTEGAEAERWEEEQLPAEDGDHEEMMRSLSRLTQVGT